MGGWIGRLYCSVAASRVGLNTSTSPPVTASTHLYLPPQAYWIGESYRERGIAGNDITRTNLPNMRCHYRHLVLKQERTLHSACTASALAPALAPALRLRMHMHMHVGMHVLMHALMHMHMPPHARAGACPLGY